MSEIDRQTIKKLKEGLLLAFSECFFYDKSELSTKTVPSSNEGTLARSLNPRKVRLK